MATGGTPAHYRPIPKPKHNKICKIGSSDFNKIFSYIDKIMEGCGKHEKNPERMKKQIYDSTDKLYNLLYGDATKALNPVRREKLVRCLGLIQEVNITIQMGNKFIVPHQRLAQIQALTEYLIFVIPSEDIGNDPEPDIDWVASCPAATGGTPSSGFGSDISPGITPSPSASRSLFERMTGARASTKSVSQQSVHSSGSGTGGSPTKKSSLTKLADWTRQKASAVGEMFTPKSRRKPYEEMTDDLQDSLEEDGRAAAYAPTQYRGHGPDQHSVAYDNPHDTWVVDPRTGNYGPPLRDYGADTLMRGVLSSSDED